MAARNGRIWSLPSEQFIPTLSSGICETEAQNASTVCPERLRPLMSTAVNDAITGTRAPISSNTVSMAYSAALALSVSKTVSTSRISAPPSSSPRACSE